jgi:two-component system NtrC family sensor kinase
MSEEYTKSANYPRSLNRNIILIIIVISLIPLTIVSITIYYQFRVSYHEKVYEHLRELVHSHTQTIDSFLNEKLADIRFLTDICGWDNLHNENFLRDRLRALQNDFGRDFVDLGIVNAKGEQLAYAGPFLLEKVDYSNAEWFRRAIQSDYYVSDVFLGIRGLPHFIITVRKTNALGDYWILRATIDFVEFTTLVENIRLGQTGFAYIINQQGEMQTKPTALPDIATIDSEKIYSEIVDKREEVADKVRIALLQDESSHENIYAASFLKNGDWLFVYQQRVVDAFSDLNKTFLITTALMIVGFIIIISMAVILSRTVVRRVARSEQETQMMSKKVVEAGKLASVGELAAGIAHEINNPVAIMVEEAGWMGDLLEDMALEKGQDRAEFERAIKQIQTQGKRCKDITHKLLSFARQTDATIEDVDILRLLEELIELSAQRAKYAMVKIKTDFGDNLPTLKVSATELQQVFFNLINNALDAMEKQGGDLNIFCHRENDSVTIKVADTGGGIPKANLDRIFDPFFTTKPVGKGTGLGLSICYGIIEKMGGNLSVDSVVGQGTTFTISIPLKAGRRKKRNQKRSDTDA